MHVLVNVGVKVFLKPLGATWIIALLVLSACSSSSETPQAGQGAQPPAPASTTSVATPTTGLVVQRIWTTERVSGRTPAGTLEVKPDPGHVLMIVDVTAVGQSPVSLQVGQLEATGGGVKVAPVGAAPLSIGNFDTFSGLVSGWRTVSDAQNRAVKMGRETESQPIQLTIDPGAIVSIVYIVPESGSSLAVTLPGSGNVPLVPRS